MIPQQVKNLGSALKQGFLASEEISTGLKEVYPTTLAPRFKNKLKQEGISLRETPAQFLGAFSARVLTDLTNDEVVDLRC